MSLVKFSDVVQRANTKEDKDNTDKIYYVGGEHIDSNNVLITERGIIKGSTIGPMFYFGFKAGQVLFVSRNPHLRKAGMVTFDGICSEKTFVLETKNEDILSQRFLPFVMQSNHFWSYMESHKSGSVNYFINWSTLANYEFDLPGIEEQKRLAELLWSIKDTKTAYEKLNQAIDEVVKSQFIEMFNKKKRVRLGDYIQQIRGVSYKPADLNLELDDEHITLLRANNIGRGVVNFDEVQYVSRKKVSETQIIREKDILLCASSGSIEHVGKSAICTFEGEFTFGAFCKLIRVIGGISAEFISAYLQGDEYRRIISDLAQGTNINNLRNEYIDELLIPFPEADEEKEFVEIMKQSDKSKFEIKKCVETTEKLLHRIIDESIN